MEEAVAGRGLAAIADAKDLRGDGDFSLRRGNEYVT
jgi:hypothetical protein